MSRNFHVIVERDTEGYFVASVPALPGCHTQVRSLDDLSERIKEAIELYLPSVGDVLEPLEGAGVQRFTFTSTWYDEEEELRRYIWGFCKHLLTDLERRADHVAFVRAKYSGADREEERRFWLKNNGVTESPDVDRVLSAGWEAFRESVFQRIVSERGESILNRCPRCRRIVKTPKARQCLWCGHDWHGAAT
jgi:predicted RNase H-like HicB family nuclease